MYAHFSPPCKFTPESSKFEVDAMKASIITKQRLPSGKACVSCRKRKNRCDGARPQCSTCQSRGIPCDYPAVPTERLTIEELRLLMKAKLRENAEVVSDSEGGAISPSSSQPPRVDAAAMGDERLADLGAFTRGSSNMFDGYPSVGPSSTPTATGVALDSDATVAAARASDIPGQTPPASSPSETQEPDGYFGESSTFAFVSEISTGSVLDAASSQRKKRRRLSSTGSARTVSLDAGLTPRDSIECYELPSKQLADGLVDAYFAHVHRLYPFVHESTFRREYERMWVSPNAVSRMRPLWFGLLNLIFAHGCEFCDSVPKTESVSTASRFVSHARRIVFAHVFTEGSLELVQALLLMCHYLQSTLELNECWSLVGLMIRTSISLGLHFNAPDSEALTPVQREVSRRLWWGCYVIDRTLSMKFGRPPSIQGEGSFNIDMPLDVDDQYISQDSVEPRQPEGRPSLITFFTQTIKLAGVVEKVLLDLYQPIQRGRMGGKSQRRDNIHSYLIGHAVLLDADLLSWWNEVPQHLKREPEVPDGPDFKLQRNVLFIRFLNLRLVIHRPSILLLSKHDINDSLQKAVVVASSQTCINAARETIRVIHLQYRRRLLNSLWYNLHYVFTAMGVLLSLQSMDKAKLETLGETSYDSTLELGMDFLQAASSTSTLSARYIAMLRRIRACPTDATATSGVGQPQGTPRQGDIHSISAAQFPNTPDEGHWFPRSPNGDFGIFGDLALVDSDDLLFGTGLPRDLLPTDWSAMGLLH